MFKKGDSVISINQYFGHEDEHSVTRGKVYTVLNVNPISPLITNMYWVEIEFDDGVINSLTDDSFIMDCPLARAIYGTSDE